MTIEGSKTSLDAWAQLLGLDPADKAAVVGASGQIVSLISEARQQVQAHPELKQDLYLGTLTTIESLLLNQAPLAQWGSIVGNLKGAPIQLLEFCAESLDRLDPQTELPSEILDALRADVDNLVTRIAESSLDEPVKATLVIRLEELRAAILRYRITGIKAIEAATDAAVGAAVVAQARTPTGKHRETINDYLGIIQKVLEIIEKAERRVPLLKPALSIFTKWLLKGPL